MDIGFISPGRMVSRFPEQGAEIIIGRKTQELLAAVVTLIEMILDTAYILVAKLAQAERDEVVKRWMVKFCGRRFDVTGLAHRPAPDWGRTEKLSICNMKHQSRPTREMA
jgi:hypothetical protein